MVAFQNITKFDPKEVIRNLNLPKSHVVGLSFTTNGIKKL